MKAYGTNVSGPRYLMLRVDGSPLGPRCREYAGETCIAVYGFTSRDAYEEFSANAGEPLRPYPLVRGYLTRVLDHKGLLLIALDAHGCAEQILDAIPIDETFAAKPNGNRPAPNSYRLMHVPDTEKYDVQSIVR